MIHVPRMFTMIHTRRSVGSRTVPIALVIPVSRENTSGNREQGDAGQYKQDKFHNLNWFSVRLSRRIRRDDWLNPSTF